MKIQSNISQTNSRKIRLDEVTLMRTILAVLIVFMHSFTCYNGGWRIPEGYVDIPLYKWLSRLSFAFTLESFVFISGYLFAFQTITLKRVYGCGELIFNKLKRLIIPSVLFSILYFVLFYKYIGLPNMIYSVINGCGHMWYLPMLFWCFLGGWILTKVHIRNRHKLLLLALLNLCAGFPLPLQFGRAFSFLFYFQLGYAIYQHRDTILLWISRKKLVLVWLLFVATFVIFRPMRDYCMSNSQMSLIQKAIMFIADNACHLFYAVVGSLTFYCTALFYTQHTQLKPFTIMLATTCFGVYLFQQFFLQILYYKTTFPILVGPYMLPWLGFAIALVLSFLCSRMMLKTKVGRYLIG